ncbi:MAG TPA: outer membrane lipoprotein carrier protein LolA [Blastocatellia bacterium]|nr:outer membrane lipoprotein carrier protein LolA [Blastocatellia bacterium]
MSQLFIRPALLLAFLFINAVAVSAQTDLNRAINGLQAKYNKITSLSAEFSQIHTERGQRERRESGRLLLKKPGKMKWNYMSPEEKLFISDGKYLFEYVKSDNYATRSTVSDSEDLRAPFAFLLGQGNLRREFRRIEFAKESPLKANNKVLRMLPKHLQDFEELLIEFDPFSFEMYRLSIVKGGGERSDFIFSDIRENVSAPSAEFVFKAPAGVEIRNN